MEPVVPNSAQTWVRKRFQKLKQLNKDFPHHPELDFVPMNMKIDSCLFQHLKDPRYQYIM